MTNLPNAPLIYSLGVAGFPAVPEIERFVPRFHDAIRDRYPHVGHVKMQQANVQMSSDGLKVDEQVSPIWQFAAPNREWAFVLSPQILALHTIRYVDHVSFADAFEWGLDRLIAVPELKLAFLQAVGIRYIDRIVPQGGENLRDYLTPAVLPPAFDEVENLHLTEAVYVSRYQTSEGQLRFQVLLNPPNVLPPELETPLIRANGWMLERPAGEFAIVDTDHGTSFAELKTMDAGMVKDHMLRLRIVAKAVFEGMATHHAKNVWRGNNA